MPESLAASTAATILLAVLAAAGAYLVHRYGDGPAPEPLAALWHRPEPPPPTDLERSVMAFAEEGSEERRRFFRRRRERVAEEDLEAFPEPDAPEEHEADVRAEAEQPVWEAAGPPASSAAVPTAVPPRERPLLDHVPLEPPRGPDEPDAGEVRLRDRFRRGLKKTRDYLNRDVREVFGPGPVPEAFDDLEEVLVRADIGVATATAMADELRERGRELTSDTLPQALKEAMRHTLSEADRRLRVNPGRVSVWMMVGVNGTGKTTSVAKLAAHAQRHGFRVCIAAADTFRAAAIEQLETWGGRLGIDVVRQHPGADPAAVVFDAVDHAKARNLDLVVVDTAGRLHTRTPLMDELKKVRKVLDREPGLLTETLLVLDATTGQNGIAQARAFGEAVQVSGLVLTKLDGTAKGGIVFAVEREFGTPVKAVGIGEAADDLAPFDPDAFVDAMFG